METISKCAFPPIKENCITFQTADFRNGNLPFSLFKPIFQSDFPKNQRKGLNMTKNSIQYFQMKFFIFRLEIYAET